jgi:hypothetical protein
MLQQLFFIKAKSFELFVGSVDVSGSGSWFYSEVSGNNREFWFGNLYLCFSRA